MVKLNLKSNLNLKIIIPDYFNAGREIEIVKMLSSISIFKVIFHFAWYIYLLCTIDQGQHCSPGFKFVLQLSILTGYNFIDVFY